MNKKNLTLSIGLALVLYTGNYANDHKNKKERFDINSIEYIEEEPEIDLGFNTADYLPEDFDPYAFYFNLESINFIEDDKIDFDSSGNLPEGFDAYAIPRYFRNIDYLDPEDEIELDFDSKKNLPENFDPYIKK